MNLRRKTGSLGERLWLWLWLWVLGHSGGYGECPIRTAALFLITILGFELVCSLFELIGPDGSVSGVIGESLYFSVVTRSALRSFRIQDLVTEFFDGSQSSGSGSSVSWSLDASRDSFVVALE